MDAQVLGRMVSELAAEVQAEASDLGQLEDAVLAQMRQLGQQVLSEALSERRGYTGSQHRCACGGRQWFKDYRNKQVLTSLGPVTVRRAYYYCGICGRGSHPYDAASGLGSGQLSARLSATVSLVATHTGFAQAGRLVEELIGIRVDDNTLARTAEQAGGVAMAREQEAVERFQASRAFPEARVRPSRLYVSWDGTTAPMRDGWREAKCAAIYWADAAAGRQQRYVSGFQSSERFGWQVWCEACRCGLREAEEVVVLADGAEWIWKQVQTYMPRAVQILDWYHASEHVWACAHKLYGEGSESASAWADRMLGVLWEQGGRALLDRLRGSPVGAERTESLAELTRYVTNNVSRMDYPAYRRRGLDVGSGPVEAACKVLVGARLKQAGMRWTLPGAAAILSLRTLWCNDDWRAFWESKPLAA